MKRYLVILFTTITVLCFAQNSFFKGHVLDYETHDTVKNVRMSLVCRGVRHPDTTYVETNVNGFFSFPVKQCPEFYLLPADKKYRQLYKRLNLNDTAGTITYYLYESAITGYFQEFEFTKNSEIPIDTSLFRAWWLNEKQDTVPKITLKGYYAPGEKKAVAAKRAKAVFDGFISRGANPKSFVISTDCFDKVQLSYGHHLQHNGVEYFFKQGLVVDENYINTLTGDRKEAAMKLLQTVRLTYSKK